VPTAPDIALDLGGEEDGDGEAGLEEGHAVRMEGAERVSREGVVKAEEVRRRARSECPGRA
jgi:hypothetical protein